MSGRKCFECGGQMTREPRNHRYTESGLSNVVLQGVEISDCQKCGNPEFEIPRMSRLHRLLAIEVVKWPVRLNGEQIRFLRTRLNLTGEDFARYLHTDKTKISKWERGQDRVGPSSDRLIRLLVAALDPELGITPREVAAVLPRISDVANQIELHLDVTTGLSSLLRVNTAA